MKLRQLFTLFPLFAGMASAATIVNFDSGADPSLYTLDRFGAQPGPTVAATDGNPGGFLQITREFGGLHNFVPFNQTDPGTFAVSTFAFDFRIDRLGGGGADGISFSYLDTATHGTTGTVGALFTAEDPAAAGVLGFGFDTYGNGGAFDANDFAGNYSEITVFFNGVIVSRVDDTRALAAPFDLKDGAWHRVNGTIDFAGAKVSLSVDTIPVFENVDVLDLVPFESRILFAGRTGGSSERAGIDNLSVLYIPEPATSGLLVVGMLVLRRARGFISPRDKTGPAA
jgi:hypothetical protein